MANRDINPELVAVGALIEDILQSHAPYIQQNLSKALDAMRQVQTVAHQVSEEEEAEMARWLERVARHLDQDLTEATYRLIAVWEVVFA